MQHKGDMVIDGRHETRGQITGTTYVRADGVLVAHGQLAGGLIIEDGGTAIVHGQVSRNVVNNGRLILYGQVSDMIIGNQPENSIGPHQIVGLNLEVPFRGTTTSWSTSY